MIPESLEGVDAAFLTNLLQSRFPGIRVEAVSVAGSVHGTATKARLRLRYATGVQGPETMFVKGGWEEGSEILRSVGIFAREPRVYAELLPGLGVRHPCCYGAVWDEVSMQGVLLLEDLDASGSIIRSPESHVGIDEAHAILLELAHMHGSTAGPGRLPQGRWIRRIFEDSARPESYLRHILEDAQLESYLLLPRGAAIPDELRSAGAIRSAFQRTLDYGLADEARLLLHGDAHVGNSYVAKSGKPAFLDWQCVSVGGWGYDVAYYLCSALSAEDRRANERELLDAYAKGLRAAGGPSLSPGEVMRGYTAYLSYGLLVWLANSTSFQPETFNSIVAGRFAHAILDHDMM